MFTTTKLGAGKCGGSGEQLIAYGAAHLAKVLARKLSETESVKLSWRFHVSMARQAIAGDDVD